MKKNVYAVRDSAVEIYGNPFIAINHTSAVRDFDHACRDPQSQMSVFPSDFSLWHIGTYNDDSGLIEACPPVMIRDSISLKQE